MNAQEDYKRYKVCIFGDGGVGKTTLTHRFLDGVFKETYQLTIGMDFYVKKLNIDGKKISLQIWDFAGEEKFRFLLPGAVAGADGCIFMFDITRFNTFKNLSNWLSIFNEINEKENQNPSIILVGSKIDLKGLRSINIDEANKFAKKNKFQDYIECSSKTGENVDEILNKISKLIIKNSN
jgi:small GTP-binding protein